VSVLSLQYVTSCMSSPLHRLGVVQKGGCDTL